MASEKRKQQFRENQQSSRQAKRDAGLILWQIWVKPEWRQKIKDYIDKLRKGNAE